jgi:protein TonB
MDYAQQQRNPAKHLVGFTVVVLLHVLIVWFIMNGLARKVIDVIKKPLETQIIEEVKPPPPPPPVQLPPPPKFIAPPPPFIPPPEVQVNVPPPPNAIQTTSNVPVEAPPIAAVAPAPAPPAPAAPPAPPSIRAACTNYAKQMGDTAYPRDAIKEGLDRGEAVVRFTVSATGEIKDIVAVSSSNRAFARAAITAVHDFKCSAQGRDIVFEVPFSFRRE